MKFNIKPATIARLGALIVALINQCLAIFGKGVLPFTENMAYQIISLAAVIIVAAINAWYNNDITKIALLCGGIFDALSDGKLTEKEVEQILIDAENPKKAEEVSEGNFVVNAINGLIKKIKAKGKK